ncbi:MAG: GatB/YqeY domain-containing protein [Pseudomonadota bacterium]
MSHITKRLEAALAEARENGDDVKICTLRLMIAAIRDREAAMGIEDGTARLEGPALRDLLCRMVEQRKTSIRGYEEAGHTELADREGQEIEIIKGFLPKPMNESETAKAVAAAIAETGASSIRDLGRVMTHLCAQHPGRIDICDAGARVKAALG